MLKQFVMAVTAAMVVASVGTGAAATAGQRPVDRLHQHQGIPGGVQAPHHQDPHHRHGHAGG